jgi:hypothetical protein
MLLTNFADRGTLDEEECFIDATFVMAKGGGAEVATTKRGKGIMGCRFRSARTPLTTMKSASLIGRSGSSTFRLSTTAVLNVARGLALLFGLGTGPFHHGIRRRGGTILVSALPRN